MGGGLAELLRGPHQGVSLIWLGQAGFVLRAGELVVLIDPYLSDTLAEKYRGRRFEHRRAMAAPIAPDALPRVDLVMCTHRHGDHMDPGTLPVIARDHPDCRFVVPAAEVAHARGLLPAGRLVPAVDGGTLALSGLSVMPVAAAHEELETDEAGRHRFLGYGIAGPGFAFYHSGDCVPYEGLAGRVASLGVDLALLPVNGRDRERMEAGVAGNFTLDEAAGLCREAGVAEMIAHHWGLLDFNSCDPRLIDQLASVSVLPRIVRPSPDRVYRLH